MHAGPKPAVDPSELPWRPVRGPESESFADFCTRFLRLGGGKPLILRDWQRDLVASVWDGEPRPRLAAWALARGDAKTTLAAAMVCYVFMTGSSDTSVDIVAVDERQAGLCFSICAKFIARHPELEKGGVPGAVKKFRRRFRSLTVVILRDGDGIG